MNNEALILRNDQQRTVRFTETALALKTVALEKSALIAKVKSSDDQNQAIAATADLKRVHSDAEKARKACKEPVIKFGRDIDAAHAQFTREIGEEIVRLDTLVAGFQMLERERIRAEQKAADELRDKLDREKNAQIAKAQSLEQIDNIREEFAQKAADVVLPVVPVAKAEGQAIIEDWDIEVTDIWLLARAHPGCVKIEPLVGQIKSLLKAGVKEVAGVRAKPKLRNVVRASKDVPAIDV